MRNATDKPKKSTWLKNLALVVVSILCTCLLGELLLRLTVADSIVLFPRFHAAAQYGDYTLRRTQPDTRFTHTSVDGSWDFAINAQGFRDDTSYSHERQDETLRVLVLGDSHTMGYEVRQHATFAQIIEHRLTALGMAAETLNTGVSGFSTAEALVFLENEGLLYNPDYVVLGFFSNDFEDNLKAGLFRLDGDDLVVAKQSHVPGVWVLDIVNAIPGLPWLSQNSYLYSLLLNTVWDLAKRALLDDAVADLQTEYAIGTQEADAEMTRLAMHLIERMHAVTEARGIPLIIVEVPTAEEQDFGPSIPAELQDRMAANAEMFITADSVLAPYRGLTQFHSPGGHRHINEFTHLMLGMAIADGIVTLNGQEGSTAEAVAN